MCRKICGCFPRPMERKAGLRVKAFMAVCIKSPGKFRFAMLAVLAFAAACGSSRPATETGTEAGSETGTATETGAEKPFYYDEVHHVMVRIGAEPQPGLLERYNRHMEEHPWLAYRFYQDEVLKLETAFDRIIYTVPEFMAMGFQPELTGRPLPVYPEKKPIAGRVLIVEVSMIIAPDGRVEYAELANIRRNENEPESRSSTAVNGEIPKWTGSSLHELDLPYILQSLENAVEYVFRPVELEEGPVRFNVIVSYIYEADKVR
jgi:hypothetical protein